MECISELRDSLNAYFGWNKARWKKSVTPQHVIPNAVRDLLSGGTYKIKIMTKTLEKICGYDQIAA
jgi:hypothetical protein